MTTGSGKKTSKTGKAPASRGRRKKVVAKAPVPAEIDKQKMAAFFSAAGLDNSSPDSVKETAEVEEAKETVSEESGAQLAAESAAASVAENGPADESEPAVKEPENDETVVVAEPADAVATDSDNRDDSDNEKGEIVMTTTSKSTGGGSDSGSFSVLPMVFGLTVLALFWFYYISSAPLKTAAEARVEQGKAEISVLMSKIKGLEAEVARLRAKLVVFEKAAHQAKKLTGKVSAPVKRGVVAGEKAAAKAVSKDAQVPAAAIKKDPSFDKAPVPFWRQMQRGPLTQPRKEVKPAVKETPAAKGDSFSKAPKPFWLKPRVKPEAAKVKKEVKISAPPAAKAVSKIGKEEPASAPALDPSFKKAPKPFWLKD